jgi:hypothetical protein
MEAGVIKIAYVVRSSEAGFVSSFNLFEGIQLALTYPGSR